MFYLVCDRQQETDHVYQDKECCAKKFSLVLRATQIPGISDLALIERKCNPSL